MRWSDDTFRLDQAGGFLGRDAEVQMLAESKELCYTVFCAV